MELCPIKTSPRAERMSIIPPPNLMARMMLPKEPINCAIRQSIITTQRVVLSMKYILEMFHPGRGSLNCINSWCSVSHNYFSCYSGKELKRPTCDSHLEKWVLLRATEPVFICTGISPKEIRRDLVIRMSIIGSFTTGKKCKQLRCPTIDWFFKKYGTSILKNTIFVAISWYARLWRVLQNSSIFVGEILVCLSV